MNNTLTQPQVHQFLAERRSTSAQFSINNIRRIIVVDIKFKIFRIKFFNFQVELVVISQRKTKLQS